MAYVLRLIVGLSITLGVNNIYAACPLSLCLSFSPFMFINWYIILSYQLSRIVHPLHHHADHLAVGYSIYRCLHHFHHYARCTHSITNLHLIQSLSSLSSNVSMSFTGYLMMPAILLVPSYA